MGLPVVLPCVVLAGVSHATSALPASAVLACVSHDSIPMPPHPQKSPQLLTQVMMWPVDKCQIYPTNHISHEHDNYSHRLFTRRQ